MKRAITIPCLSLLIIFMVASVSHAQYFVTNRLTYTDTANWEPEISDNGYVIWFASDSGPEWDYEIFIYNGVNITQVTDNEYDEWFPKINNNWSVVWVGFVDGSDPEIFLNAEQITDNDYYDNGPRINDNGYVAWDGCPGGSDADCIGFDYEIFLYDGISTTQITENDFHEYGPRMNDSGHMAWVGGDNLEHYIEIFFYDGIEIIQITDNEFEALRFLDMNDSDQITWVGWYDVSGNGDIFLYDGGIIENLTNNDLWEDGPRINNSGYVSWWGSEADRQEIFLYNGVSMEQVSDIDALAIHTLEINEDGHVVWDALTGDGWDIYLYDGLGVTRLSIESGISAANPDINKNGYVVWTGYISEEDNTELFLSRPCDYDHDGYLPEYCDVPEDEVDCDDTDPDVNPGAEEICGDGIDNNCDGRIDYLFDCIRPVPIPVATDPLWFLELDGTIQIDEWEEAFVMDISMSRAPVWLYLLVDEDYLYVAVDDQSTSELGHLAGSAIYFDEDNNDAWPPVDGEEGGFGLTELDGETVLFFEGIYTQDDLVFFGEIVDSPPGVEGALSDAAGNVQSEWKISLHDSPLDGALEESIGLCIVATNGEVMTGVLRFDSVLTEPETFGDVLLGCRDADGDFHADMACGGGDCDDGDPDVNPEVVESKDVGNCKDGIDNDCDGFADGEDPECGGCFIHLVI